MGKIATKKSNKQLQIILEFLGEYGGVIETHTPETWWNLDVEVEHKTENRIDMTIGVYKSFNGDVIFDPQFYLSVKTELGKIVETQIKKYVSQTLLGTIEIDDKDMAHGWGTIEKDEYGLQRRFSNFMDNMTELAPYLTNPKKVKKYNTTLDGYMN